MEDNEKMINDLDKCSIHENSAYESESESYSVDHEKASSSNVVVKKSFSWNEIFFLITLSAVTVTSSLALCIFPPFFPPIAEKKGFGATVYGSVIGTNCLVAFLVTPMIGRHIKTLGLKFSLISGIAASGVSSILCGLLDLHPPGNWFIWSAVSTRAVQSLGNALIIISTFVYTSIQFPHKTGTIFALNRTALSVAQMIGPALGGVLYDWNGYWFPFATFGALHLFTALPLLCLAPEGKKLNGMVSDKESEANVNNCSVLQLPGIWVSFAMFFVSTLSTGFLSITLESQILRKYHLSHITLGLMFGLKDAASTVTSPLWGMVCDRYRSTKALLVLCSASAAAAYIVFGPLPGLALNQTLAMVIAALSVYGVAIGGMQICGVMDALREATGRGGLPDTSTTHGVVAGLWNSLSSGGRFISRCGAGILVDNIGFANSTSIVVSLHTVLAMVTVFYTWSLCDCWCHRCRSAVDKNPALLDGMGDDDVSADRTVCGRPQPCLPSVAPGGGAGAQGVNVDGDETPRASAALCVPSVGAVKCGEAAVSYLIGSSQTYLGPSSYHTLN